MESLNTTTFKEFISNSFTDGIFKRELRMSHNELKTVHKIFPNAKVRCIFENDFSDKNWYEVRIPSSTISEKTSIKI